MIAFLTIVPIPLVKEYVYSNVQLKYYLINIHVFILFYLLQYNYMLQITINIT